MLLIVLLTERTALYHTIRKIFAGLQKKVEKTAPPILSVIPVGKAAILQDMPVL